MKSLPALPRLPRHLAAPERGEGGSSQERRRVENFKIINAMTNEEYR